MNQPAIYVGRVMHHRLLPKQHRFSYAHYFVRFPLDEMAALKVPGFSLDKFNLFSFYSKDHGPRDGSNLAEWARGVLSRNDITTADGEIDLYALPRVLGYVFNPVSFWFCHDKQHALRAILCEVNNTFGEHHVYLLAHPDLCPIEEGQELRSQKLFHVSPFMATEGGYRFSFKWHDKAVFRIDHHDNQGNLLLATTLAGAPRDYTSRNFFKLLLRFMWLTVLVMLRIHWHALLLWGKGLKFFSKPVPPDEEVTK